MRIVVAGTMKFAKEMKKVGKQLRKSGHKVTLPRRLEEYIEGKASGEDPERKKKLDVIRKYFKEIKNADAILILNYDNVIPNKIGGNSFLEMGFAYVLKKKIFLLNPVPKMDYTDEILSMEPVVLHGDLSKIK